MEVEVKVEGADPMRKQLLPESPFGFSNDRDLYPFDTYTKIALTASKRRTVWRNTLEEAYILVCC